MYWFLSNSVISLEVTVKKGMRSQSNSEEYTGIYGMFKVA